MPACVYKISFLILITHCVRRKLKKKKIVHFTCYACSFMIIFFLVHSACSTITFFPFFHKAILDASKAEKRKITEK